MLLSNEPCISQALQFLIDNRVFSELSGRGIYTPLRVLILRGVFSYIIPLIHLFPNLLCMYPVLYILI